MYHRRWPGWEKKPAGAAGSIKREFGRETLRVNADGTPKHTTAIALALGSALTPKWITTGFAEGPVGVYCSVDGDVDHMLTFLRDVHRFTARQLATSDMAAEHAVLYRAGSGY